MEPLPDDIDLERRKKIIAQQIKRILSKREIETRRLKTLEFARNKRRKKIADRSKRRNRV